MVEFIFLSVNKLAILLLTRRCSVGDSYVSLVIRTEIDKSARNVTRSLVHHEALRKPDRSGGLLDS